MAHGRDMPACADWRIIPLQGALRSINVYVKPYRCFCRLRFPAGQQPVFAARTVIDLTQVT